jgi:hypothetical protein
VDKPTPPDMKDLVAAYATPGAPLDATSAAEAFAPAARFAKLIDDLGLDEETLEPIQSAIASRIGDAGSSSGGTMEPAVTGEGYVRVTRICDGWGPMPVPDGDANGLMVGTIGFTEHGPDPVAWGTFSRCEYLIAGKQVLVGGRGGASEGHFDVYLGEGLAYADFGKKPVLFRVDLSASIDGSAEDVSADFQIDPAALTLATRIATRRGDLVVVLAVTTVVGVRASNGVFTCDMSQRTCTSDGGGTISF